jgi:NAD(P)H-dependent flavin oxidoreductase YrpB (nitropropane dioxygenase family)
VFLPSRHLSPGISASTPVVQAPIGSATGPELAAAVSEAGGLGTLAVTWRDPDAVLKTVAATRERTDGPVGANVVVDPDATATWRSSRCTQGRTADSSERWSRQHRWSTGSPRRHAQLSTLALGDRGPSAIPHGYRTRRTA